MKGCDTEAKRRPPPELIYTPIDKTSWRSAKNHEGYTKTQLKILSVTTAEGLKSERAASCPSIA